MASLDSLPSDQRAVLELVLRRGRSYDDIARLLSIDRAGVRERALAGFDALGPDTDVPPERRALITDYLLGQLPSRVSEDTRDRLAASPSERAWARVLASELAPLASGPLPEIPTEARREPAPAAEPAATPAPEASAPPPEVVAAAPEAQTARTARRERTPRPAARRSSRRGGAILLAVVGVAVIVVVVVLLATGGSSKKHTTTAARASTGTTSTAGSTTTATPLAQVNLVSPTAGSKAAGVAVVLRQGTTTAIAIRAQNVPANSKHDAYAVWLYNSPSDSVRLGFVNPPVGGNGVLQTLGPLPSNAGHFSQVLVTLETSGSPRTPGKIVLQGALKGV